MEQNGNTTLGALEAAYLLMLQMPHTGLRLTNQRTFCQVRDAIAQASGLTDEQVQTSFEQMALEQQLLTSPKGANYGGWNA